MLSCPACLDERILTICDIAEVVEVAYAHYMDGDCWDTDAAPWWTHPLAGKAVAHVVHSRPEDEGRAARVAVGLSKRRRACYTNVFDDSPPTFTHLPALWDAETAEVAAAR